MHQSVGILENQASTLEICGQEGGEGIERGLAQLATVVVAFEQSICSSQHRPLLRCPDVRQIEETCIIQMPIHSPARLR